MPDTEITPQEIAAAEHEEREQLEHECAEQDELERHLRHEGWDQYDEERRLREEAELRAADEAEQELLESYARAAAERRQTNAQRGATTGGSFFLDLPERLPVVWGSAHAPMWVEGEGFMVTGPQGVGKTTLAQQLVLGLAGLRDELLGWPITPTSGKVLYLAMDRPLQIARAGSRLASEQDRERLDEMVVVWRGPLEFNLMANPRALASWARDEHGATVVVVDSYKDLVPDLSSETTGALLNAAVQECLAEGIQWFGLHHGRKAQADNREPKHLADVYGSNWLTAGLGSVLGLWGEPGDELVRATHLKQPAESLGTFGIRHDHTTGTSTLTDAPEQADGRSSGRMARRDRIVELHSDGEVFTVANLRPEFSGVSRRTLETDTIEMAAADGPLERVEMGAPERRYRVRP